MNQSASVTAAAPAHGPAPAAVAARPRSGLVSAAALIALIAALCGAPWLSDLPPVLVRAAVLVAFTISAWAFGFLAEPVNSLVFFLLANLFAISKAATIFSGLYSPAWWLVLGGSITGIAVQITGLGARWAKLLFARSAGSYRRYVTAVALAAIGLGFVMPSTTGRILLLMPIVLALADRVGLTPGSNGHTGLVMTVAAASYMPPATILPANIPNTVLLGAAESLYGIKLTYGPYLLLHFPILGALKAMILVWLVCRLYPESQALPITTEEDHARSSSRQRLLAGVLALSLLLFATDFLHGVSPAWVSLGAGIACLLPFMDIVGVKTFSEKMNLTPLIYVAGFLGLGAVVTESGLGKRVSEALLELAHLVPGHPAANLAALAVIGAGIGLLTTLPGLPAVLTPLAADFARTSGLPLPSVLMLQVVVFSTVFLPYQAPPMMIAMHLGGVRVRAASRLTLSLAAITVLVLIPLDYLWWKLLGYA